MRTLIVEDRWDTAEMLEALVSLWGHETRIARNGQDAIELADAYRPDVILLDIGLPGRHGYDVAHEIRRRPWASRILIVAITGHDQRRERLEAEGIDAALVKPFEPEQLKAILDARITPAPPDTVP